VRVRSSSESNANYRTSPRRRPQAQAARPATTSSRGAREATWRGESEGIFGIPGRSAGGNNDRGGNRQGDRGRPRLLGSMILYLDTNAFLYGISGIQRFQEPARTWQSWQASIKNSFLVTSRLTLMEALVGPIKRDDSKRITQIESALDHLLLIDLDNSVMRRAAEIRARYRFRAPDAIRLAAAAEVRADVFLTGDRRLRSFDQVRVVDVLRDRPETFRP
jgi:predicted nucleic acid-binding protein